MKIILIIVMALWAGSSSAGQACYSPKEAAAEKVLRLHSELMVITVTCKQGSTGRDLGRAYSRLTQTHIKPIRSSERILKAFYAKRHGGNGIERLDRLRTKLANEYSQIVARESAAAFCERRRDQVTKLYDSRHLSFQTESLRANRHIKLNSPTCRKVAQMAQKRRKRAVWD